MVGGLWRDRSTVAPRESRAEQKIRRLALHLAYSKLICNMNEDVRESEDNFPDCLRCFGLEM